MDGRTREELEEDWPWPSPLGTDPLRSRGLLRLLRQQAIVRQRLHRLLARLESAGAGGGPKASSPPTAGVGYNHA